MSEFLLENPEFLEASAARLYEEWQDALAEAGRLRARNRRLKKILWASMLFSAAQTLTFIAWRIWWN